MSTIYELQARAETLRKKKATGSISAEDTFGLHADGASINSLGENIAPAF